MLGFLEGLEEKVVMNSVLHFQSQMVEEDKKLYEEPLRQKILDSFNDDFYKRKKLFAGVQPFRAS